MRDNRRASLRIAGLLLLTWTWHANAGAAHAQAPHPEAPTDTGVVADDDLTLVVGTRFVAPTGTEASAKVQFTEARIPLSRFNATDHCVDQHAVEAAQAYFTTLGRVMGKAGHYYFLDDAEIRRFVAICERMHGAPPQAWIDSKTKVMAFGKVVPTVDAPALEQSVR